MEDQIIKVITEQIFKEPGDITVDMDLTKQDFIDSIDQIEIIVALEDKFDVIIEDEERYNHVTVRQLAELISTKISNK